MGKIFGIRDLIKNSNILDQYDYIDIEDKRTHQYKGLFVSPKYADELKEYLKKKILKQKQKDVDEIMQFAGVANGECKEMNVQELTRLKRKRYKNE